MPTNYEPLVLTIEPAYVGSAVSPTVDITETSDDVTVTITDFRGEHSYTVEKTDQAIADAEAAATNANAAATNADTKGQQAVDIATTAAVNAEAKAGLADTAATAANSAASTASTAATNASTAAQTATDAAALITDKPNAVLEATVEETTPQTVTDAWPTTPRSAELYGKSVQDGTPTPANPIAVQVVEAPNKSGFFSVPKTDSEYWINSGGSYITELDDGWARFYDDNSAGTGVQRIYYRVRPFDFIKPDTDYTFLLEFRNVVSVGETGFYANIASTSAGYISPFETSASHQIANGAYLVYAHSKADLSSVDCLTYGRYQVAAGGKADFEVRISLYEGQYSGGYVPVGYIGLQIGETVTPIDMQSNVLASLPDGTKDVLNVDSAGHVAIDKRVGYIASYSGESVGSVYLSTTGALTTGASVYYKLTTQTTIDLGTITLPELGQTSEIAMYASLNPTWAITYERDPNVVISSIESSIAPVEGAKASANYAVGSYLVHDSRLYKVTSAIATGENITPGTNCTQTTVMAELVSLTA